ncbi:hypothetical protein TWF569_007025 [Orbilia oligospora]|uniref:UBZ4-type domain-containing protein n=1 Tax=Orbilia oligospora TaxID=2813651 RepID=A0A7C8IXK1_ORBOL|nr:hypothetical protein TWF102_002417 [Orbilia oligospora]KAF3108510.1 hypothetical protein TWF103_005589 [Orbilia oligospora]KAF3144839.1 hypothetical protein TWF569_007025 [Orbilia oligospora]KAF3147665.1 hypothetical protein TWF594_002262 [Orbilia oligospora]
MSQRISCPVCNRDIALSSINRHLDEGCPEEPNVSETSASGFFTLTKNKASAPSAPSLSANSGRSTINPSLAGGKDWLVSSPASKQSQQSQQKRTFSLPFQGSSHDAKKSDLSGGGTVFTKSFGDDVTADPDTPAAKRQKTNPARSAMPLAERVRPNTLNNIFGQDLVGPDGILRRMIESDSVKSMILWGGPGCGKTTIARTIAASTKARFVELSGTTNNIADCKKIFEQAKSELSLLGRKTILFIDEIHRFTKTQQDVFLAPVESGQVILIGATTENPSFKVQSALLSRCRVFTLKPLTTESTLKILNRALSTEFPEQSDIPPLLDDKLLTYLAEFASGDARTALNLLEISIQLASQHQTGSNQRFTQEDLKKALTRTLVYDRQGDGHYDTISAFHKSVRGNDPDAALYYLGRMIESGEDPLFISRRMMVMASEDIGLADNTLLPLATATHFAVQNVGMPEARINLAHCTVALCLAKKSTRAYRGLNNVLALLQSDPEAASAPIPLHLRNAPTTLMKTLGYGKEYKYPPNYVDGIVKQEYLPERLIGKKFLEDIDLGTRIDEEAYEEDGAREV